MHMVRMALPDWSGGETCVELDKDDPNFLQNLEDLAKKLKEKPEDTSLAGAQARLDKAIKEAIAKYQAKGQQET